jgi:hypothetical protein
MCCLASLFDLGVVTIILSRSKSKLLMRCKYIIMQFFCFLLQLKILFLRIGRWNSFARYNLTLNFWGSLSNLLILQLFIFFLDEFIVQLNCEFWLWLWSKQLSYSFFFSVILNNSVLIVFKCW